MCFKDFVYSAEYPYSACPDCLKRFTEYRKGCAEIMREQYKEGVNQDEY